MKRKSCYNDILFRSKSMLKENERLDCLIKEGYEIIQNDDVFSFQQMHCY